MNYGNHMAFIYNKPFLEFYCMRCGKTLISSDGREINPGRVMHKDKNEESLFGGPPLIIRQTAIICPQCQQELEKEGYYLNAWWSKDGFIYGTK